MSEMELPPRKKSKKRKSPPTNEATSRKPADDNGRVLSYVFGGFLLLLGGGMGLGFDYLQRAPEKVFLLLVGGGVGAFLSGVGLFIKPMTEEQLNIFQNDPNPVSVFKVMPLFWKFWLIVVLAGMIAGFVYVAQTTVRVGR